MALAFTCFFYCGNAQKTEGPNKVDAQNRRQGYWEKYHAETGKPAYKATFKDGNPIGQMLRYYENGSLQAEINYGKGLSAKAKLYYPEGGLMAEGDYLNQERDSTWLFYAPDSTLTSEEFYRKGKKEGLKRTYYADGSIAEKANYKADAQVGEWDQYYPNGHLKLKANVADGVQYEGKYTAYYEDGAKNREGSYIAGKKEGSWYEFNEDGSIHIIYVYRNGNVAEEYPKNGTFETYWPNDILRSEITYKNGKKNGAFKMYYQQGEWRTEKDKDEFGNEFPVQRLYGVQVEMEGRYLEDELNGEIITYKTDGKVKKRAKYAKGVLVK